MSQYVSIPFYPLNPLNPPFPPQGGVSSFVRSSGWISFLDASSGDDETHREKPRNRGNGHATSSQCGVRGEPREDTSTVSVSVGRDLRSMVVPQR